MITEPHPPLLLSGSSHPALARAVAAELHCAFEAVEIGRFPDGELHVRIPRSVRGEHAFVLQSMCHPVEQHLLELALIADACMRAGAERVTALVPYFGYARQDRRAHVGDPVPLRVVTDMLAAARVSRIVALDVHCATIEAISSVAFDQLTALPLLLTAIRRAETRRGVVVAPDAGAARLARRVATALDMPAAWIHKQRRSGTDVECYGITGEVEGRAPVIVDDMISTGGTIEAAAQRLLEAGCLPSITVAVTHGLFVGPARERLARLPIQRVIVTDSVPEVSTAGVRVERVGLDALFADAVRAIRAGQSLELMLSHA